MSILPDRHDPSSDGPKGEYLHEDTLFSSEYPAIFEYLSRIAVNGQTRQPSRLIVYYEDGQAMLLLTDPHSAKILFHASEGLNEGLAELNNRLASPPVKGWKKDKRARLR